MGIVFSWPEGIQTFLATVYHGSDCLFGRGREAKLIVPLSKDEKALQRTLSGSISFNKRSFDRNASGSRSFKDRTLKRNGSGSITYRGRKLERNFSGSNSSKGRILERNVSRSKSFKGRFQEGTPSGMNSIRRLDSPIEKSDCWTDKSVGASLNSGSFKEEAAAVKLQKVYKSYRTRRNLADCAVLVEELWWQAIDFVTLKRSTVSFFDISRHESASSRWARARIKAAKVGKGLSKDYKARKLAFQHWLEAIDPRHRYGHNLHFYYDAWFESDTAEPFFYWLDVGEGRDLNLDRCPRIRVQYQCIKYLGPKEREQYEVAIQDGRLLYKQTNNPVNTSRGSKWIFVLSTSKKLYVGQKRKGTFQHSSFLAGGATSAAGRLVADEGILKSIWPYSGHYLPTEENFKEFISFLEENNVDLSNVQKTPADEDDNSVQNGKMSVIGSEPVSEAEKEDQSSISKFKDVNIDKECIESNPICNETESATAMLQIEDAGKMTARQEVFADRLETYITDVNESGSAQCPENGIQSTEEQGNVEVLCYKRSLSDKNLDNSKLEVPQQSLLQRLESKKSLQSYQLGKKVSFKWSTGAGPRIICVRDYPSELRVKALEKVNLSPRCGLSSSSPRQLVSPKCAL